MYDQPVALVIFSAHYLNTPLTPKSHSFRRWPAGLLHTYTLFHMPILSNQQKKMQFSIAATFFALVALTSANFISVPGEVFPRGGVQRGTPSCKRRLLRRQQQFEGGYL
jgi:hypothetical protein